MRKGRFHFEGEHAFWNPQSRSELAWYYATSVDYLFANSLHGVRVRGGKERSMQLHRKSLSRFSNIVVV